MANDPDSLGVLKDELRRRGMTAAQIEGLLRKKKQRKPPETQPLPSKRASRGPQLPPPGDLCTVSAAAHRLDLHPKTILRFIREGRLRATRIGKSYRILRADLDAFAGVPARSEAPAEAPWVTSIVDVPGVGPELAQKWARAVTSSLNASRGRDAVMRADVVYEPERSHLKIVLIGTPGDTAQLIAMIRVWLEQLKADR
jgi:excisionase family DNA binding protein